MTIIQESVRLDKRVFPERISCRAYLTTNQENLTGNSWNKININTIDYSVGLNFNIATYKFTAPVSGLYAIYGCVHFLAASVIADKSYFVSIYKEGVAIADNSATASVAAQLSVSVYTESFLIKDDEIELYAYPEVGGGANTVDVLSGTRYTYLICRLITKEGIRQ